MRPTLLALIVLLFSACTALPAVADTAPAAAVPDKPAAQAPVQATTPPAAAPSPAAPDAATDGTPPQLYRWATDHLIAGLWYERAMAQLKAALAQDPQNIQYHLALGCAEADRAASISYAMSWRGALAAMQTFYPTELDMWEKGQKDPKNFEYSMPKPTPLPKFDVWTKDDYKQLKMTDAEANARITELSKAAKDEWTQALALCKTPDERAEAEYVQGWGLRLLGHTQGAGGASPFGGEMADMFGLTPNPDALKSLEAATKDVPNSAVYWQSVGDALYSNPEFADLISAFVPKSATVSAAPQTLDITALDAYRQSIKIYSGNPMLLYRVSLLEAKDDPKQALADLELAASGDPSNSYMPYLAAAWELKQSKFGGAFDLLSIIKAASQNAAKARNTPDANSGSQPGATSTGNDQFSVQVVAPPPPTSQDGSSTPNQDAAPPPANPEGMPGMPSQEEVAKQGADAYQDQDSRDLAMQAVALIEQGNGAPTYHTPVYSAAVPKMMAVAWDYGSQIDMDPGSSLDTLQLAQGACQFAEAAGQAGDPDDAARAARAVTAMGLKMMNSGMTGKGLAGIGVGAGVVSTGYAALEKIYQEAGDQDSAAQVQAEAQAFQSQMQSTVMQQMQNWMQSFFGSY